ncbi:LacI family DNA-binding transcriptional regulator [Pleomorphochaeta sp. DL1XJH-081]|jgi:LacI family repressor for deo operon, udp, cdd, tsx, nupC, and nupG|uniref:LacI family DNA-binding transcriptional regulator n=1 Tax=Pleomorphochaeta sp. DL1XJH-081 TaxID=3409690 RepID=UPI003BB57778
MSRKVDSTPDLKTIAEYAHVSVSSVSRVLNNIEPVSTKVKQKVNAAIDELGRPKVSRRQHIGAWALYLAIPDDMNPYFPEIIHGAVSEASRHGYVVHVLNITETQNPNSAYWKWIKRDPSVAGLVIIAGIFSNSDLEKFHRDFHKPLVVLHPWENSTLSIPTIKINYAESIKMVTQHLIDLQHKRFAFLAGALYTPDGRSPVVVEKLLGVQSTLESAGLSIDENALLEGPPTIDWGFQATKQLLSYPTSKRPTAIICSSDMVALGALHAARSSNLSIPKDVSVVGFDDISMAAHANPPLTTVAIPKQRMGRLAVQIILRLRDSQSTALNEYYMLESPLIVRESSGRAHS